jgi:hypothetical protein
VPLSAPALAECRSQVKQLREAQSKLLFPLREGEHCLRCAFYHNACPAEFKEPEDVPNSIV